MEIEIKDKGEDVSRVIKVRVEYDSLPKYCKRCKMQGHNKEECRILHPELKRKTPKEGEEHRGVNSNIQTINNVTVWQATKRRFIRTANVDVTTEGMKVVEEQAPVNNAFSSIENNELDNNEGVRKKISTKEWITSQFYDTSANTREHGKQSEIKRNLTVEEGVVPVATSNSHVEVSPKAPIR